MSVDPYPLPDLMYQLEDATLTALAGLATSPDTAPYFTGVDQAALMTVTPFARTLLDDADAAAMQATLGLPTMAGNTGKIAYWSSPDSLVYRHELHWDNTNTRLGIGTATPTAALDVVGTANITGDTTLPRATFLSTHTYFAGPLGIGITPAYPLDVSGSARLTRVGLGKAPEAGYSLVTLETSRFDNVVGIQCTPSGSYGLEVQYGAMLHSTLNVTGKIVTGTGFAYGWDPPRWPLDIVGQGHINCLGVYYGPDQAVTDGVDLRVYRGRFDKLSAARGAPANDFYAGWGQMDRLRLSDNVQPRWPLDCNGDGYIYRLGVYYGPDGNYSLRAGNTYVDDLISGQDVRATRYLQAIGPYNGIGGWADTRWTLRVYGTSYFDNTCQFQGVCGFGYAPDGNYWIRAGNSMFDYLGVGAGYGGFRLRVYAGEAHFDNSPNAGATAMSVYHYGGTAMYIRHWSSGGIQRIAFARYDGAWVGSISSDDSQTFYNTTSDRRLKTNIVDLTDGLDTILRLRPVSFDWTHTQGRGQGFLADEVQTVVAGVVTGAPDAMQDDGTIRPQMMDHSKLIPWIVSALQEVAARLTILEGAQ